MDGGAYLEFLNQISEEKPNDFIASKVECPFCRRSELTDIIDEKGPFILLKNKYPTLKDTLQLVIIESYDCSSGMADYNVEYIFRLIEFSVKHWLEIEMNDDYKSVIFYKNHGPNSGGSLKHPHMQIVGLKNIDYKKMLDDKYFEGIEIYRNDLCLVNLSDKPLSGFSEFNIIIDDDLYGLRDLSQCLKKITHYILNNFVYNCDSFNLFFYHWKEKIICKVMPRFVTSPLLLGYEIKQYPSSSAQIAERLKDMYFQ